MRLPLYVRPLLSDCRIAACTLTAYYPLAKSMVKAGASSVRISEQKQNPHNLGFLAFSLHYTGEAPMVVAFLSLSVFLPEVVAILVFLFTSSLSSVLYFSLSLSLFIFISLSLLFFMFLYLVSSFIPLCAHLFFICSVRNVANYFVCGPPLPFMVFFLCILLHTFYHRGSAAALLCSIITYAIFGILLPVFVPFAPRLWDFVVSMTLVHVLLSCIG